MNYDVILPRCFTITKPQDIWENLKPTMPYDSTTGGLDSTPMSNIMYAVVEPVNNLKLTDHHPDPLIPLWKEPTQLDPSGIAPWISSWTYPQQMVLILFWSW